MFCLCLYAPIVPEQTWPKAIKCIFLGYSLNQKGYKCYSLTTKNSTAPWMSHSLKSRHSKPKLIFRGRIQPPLKNISFGHSRMLPHQTHHLLIHKKSNPFSLRMWCLILIISLPILNTDFNSHPLTQLVNHKELYVYSRR